jgi:CRISPR-associated endonuclease/helicase Cas3
MPANAHSVNESGKRHLLTAHLQAVASLTAAFAQKLGAEELGYRLGLWHDVGKFDPAFQEYLLSCEGGVRTRRGPDHKGAGAFLAERYSGLGALLVQGHHGGLHNPAELKSWLSERAKSSGVLESLRLAKEAIDDLVPAGIIDVEADRTSTPRAAEIFFRLMFSALVDADYLDTEAHFSADRALTRGPTVSPADLIPSLVEHIESLSAGRSGPVADARRTVYESCLAAAAEPTGVFRLAAPTGSGKTLAAMAFGLHHAVTHAQERIVVAVPFISITEQTSDVYRGVFETGGRRNVVLEHHSGVQHDQHGDDFQPSQVWSRLAAENWDAPIVVTTTVQLLESLFANGPSRCRKLHRLANSVLVIDEAQALPPHLLKTILDGLRELTAHYGTTVVISTATQPAFEVIPEFRDVPSLDILPDAGLLFDALRRVDYAWRVDPALTWDQAAQRLAGEPQGLAILNTKRDALALLDALADPEALHLSTLLCGAHRRATIAEARRRLRINDPCRLVTTQVVEAGVDIDFPFVMRALGPLDSVIQAAGRCNREGRLNRGRMFVFRPAEGGIPPGAYRTGTDVTGSLLGRGDLDPDNPDASTEYFRLLFASVDTDRERIQPLREALNYPEVAARFRMIDDSTESVVITDYGTEAEKRAVWQALARLTEGAPEARRIRRFLQPYLVSVRSQQAESYRRMGLIRPITAGLGEWMGRYDTVRGLQPEDRDPDELVV